MEKNTLYLETLVKIASLFGKTKESVSMSSTDTHTSISMFTADNKKMIGDWYLDSSDSEELLNAQYEGLKALVEALKGKENDDR